MRLGGRPSAGSLIAALIAGALLLAMTPAVLAADRQPTRSELELEKLRQEVRGLQLANDRAGSVRDDLLAWAPFITVLVGVFAVVVPATREFRQQRRQRAAELEQRMLEERRRFDDLFARAVADLGSDKESVQVSAAISLQSFLRPEYAAFHDQVYRVLCANLAVQHSALVNRFVIRSFEDAIRLHVAGRKEGDVAPVDLARCQMARIDLHGVDLGEGADLAFATLKDANLSEARLLRSKGIEVNLERAQLSKANLKEAQLNGAIAKGARFHNANLVSAEFRRSPGRASDLQAAEFFGAELQGAHFDDADLRGARFNGAHLADTYFLRATLDEPALESMAGSRVVDEVPTWKRAHLDPEVRGKLERLARRE